MRRITLSEAREGMVLFEPAIDSQGRTLLGRGEVLTAKMLDRFQNYGVSDLAVEGEEGDAGAAGPQDGITEDAAAVAEAVRAELDRRFMAFRDNKLMQKLKTLAEKRLIEARTRESV